VPWVSDLLHTGTLPVQGVLEAASPVGKFQLCFLFQYAVNRRGSSRFDLVGLAEAPVCALFVEYRGQ
jgi:hypothetical protein